MVEYSLCVVVFSFVPYLLNATLGSEELAWRISSAALSRWRPLMKNCFMIAACQGGAHDSGRQTYGHSMVVDPWGVVLGELGSGSAPRPTG